MSTQNWKKTKAAGIYKDPEVNGRMKVRVTTKDPTTGQRRSRERTLSNVTMKEAQERRERLRDALKSEVQSAEDHQDVTTVTDLMTSFLRKKAESGVWNPTTLSDRKGTIADYILDPLGHLRADALDREVITEWVGWAESQRKDVEPTENDPHRDRYSQPTMDDWWRMLRSLIRQAYLAEHVDRRLLEWVKDHPGPQTPVEGRREQGTLSLDQLHELVDAAWEVVPHRAAEITVLAYTGMRRGPLYGLYWRNVDFQENLLELEHSFSDGELLERPKTGRRSVPMLRPVEAALRDQQDRLKDRPGFSAAAGDLVFPSDTGSFRYGSTVLEPCNRAANVGGIEQRVTPQVLRRSVNSRLTERGIANTILWSIIGHSSEEMTRHYSEIHSGEKYDAMSVLEPEGDDPVPGIRDANV